MEHPENLAHERLLKARDARNEEWPEPETTDFYRSLVRGASKITGSIIGRAIPELSGEIATRTLLNLHGYRGGSRFSTWFYRVARNALLRYLENAHRIPETPLEDAPEPVAAPRTPLRLPPGLTASEKGLLRLTLDGYSHREIATITGVSQRKVKYAWSQLKRKLKSQMSS